MGCGTCKSECGREDGCGTRKAVQKDILDALVARLYPSRTWGEPDDAACFRAGLHTSEVVQIAQRLSAVLKAPAYVQAGGPDDLCTFIYVLCIGREPALIELREGEADTDPGGPDGPDGPDDAPAAPASTLTPEAAAIRERYLRIACSTVGRLACVQEVAMELDTDAGRAPDGMAVIRELVQPGVFDPKLLKRFQKTVDLLMAHGIEHLDLGLLDVPAAQFGLLPGGYEARFGGEPALLNFFFYAAPVLTASSSFVPLSRAAVQALSAPPPPHDGYTTGLYAPR